MFCFFKKISLISLILYDVHLGSYVASRGGFFNFSYFLGYPPRILGGFTWRLQRSLQLVIVGLWVFQSDDNKLRY